MTTELFTADEPGTERRRLRRAWREAFAALPQAGQRLWVQTMGRHPAAIDLATVDSHTCTTVLAAMDELPGCELKRRRVARLGKRAAAAEERARYLAGLRKSIADVAVRRSISPAKHKGLIALLEAEVAAGNFSRRRMSDHGAVSYVRIREA